MATTTSRWTIRVLLFLILAGVVFAGYRKWRLSQPEYRWQRVQAALARGDDATAEVELLTLMSLQPERGETHLAMAELLLGRAKEEDPAATYGTSPHALRALMAAGRLLPEDLELQKQLLDLHVPARRMQDAARVAENVIEEEPGNANAVYALAWKAVDSKEMEDAKHLLDHLAGLAGRPLFSTIGLRMELANVMSAAAHEAAAHEAAAPENNVPVATPPEEDSAEPLSPEEAALAAQTREAAAAEAAATKAAALEAAMLEAVSLKSDAIDEAAQEATSLSATELEALDPLERNVMSRILLAGVQEAGSAMAAHTRAAALLTVLERIDAESPDVQGNFSELVENAIHAWVVLEARNPADSLDSERRRERDELSQRMESLERKTIAAGQASPLVYAQAARYDLGRGDDDAAMELLRQGIAAHPNAEGQAAKQLLDLHLLLGRQLIVHRRYGDAQSHITALLADEDSKGWGHLMAGNVALAEGRNEQALDEFLQAKMGLGDTMLVRNSIVNALLALGRWDEALPRLQAMRDQYDQFDEEQRASADQQLGSRDQIVFNEFRANLSMGNWAKAQEILAGLSGTKFEPAARSAAAAFLLTREDAEQKQAGHAILVESRRAFPEDINLLNIELQALAKDDKTDEAFALCRDFADRHPDDLAAQLLLVRWHLTHGQNDEALEALHTLAVRFPNDAAVQWFEARAHLNRGDADRALAVAEAMRADPQNRTAANVIEAFADLSQKDLAGAAAALESNVGDNDRNGFVDLLQGQLASAAGDYEGAIDLLTSSFDVSSMRDVSRGMLLRSLVIYAQQKGPDAADERLNGLIDRYPEDAQLHVVRAGLALAQKQPNRAMASIQRAQQLDPESSVVAYLSAVALVGSGYFQEAIPYAERAVQLSPEHVPSLNLACQASLMANQSTQALSYAVRALKQDPKQWNVYLLQAEALSRLGRKDEALAVAMALTKSRPDLSAGYQAVANLKSAESRYDEAIEALQDGLRHVPNDLGLVVTEIVVLCRAGRAGDAESLAINSADQEPDANRCFAIGRAFAKGGENDLARNWGEKTLPLTEGALRAQTHLFLGNLAMIRANQPGSDKSQAHQQAREHFEAVIDVEKTNFLAGNNLSWLLATEFGEPQAAVEVAEAVRGDADVSQLPLSFVDTLAEVYRRADEPDKAQKLLEDALRWRPDSASLHYQLGLVHDVAHRRLDARASLENALKLGLDEKKIDKTREVLERLQAEEELEAAAEAERETAAEAGQESAAASSG